MWLPCREGHIRRRARGSPASPSSETRGGGGSGLLSRRRQAFGGARRHARTARARERAHGDRDHGGAPGSRRSRCADGRNVLHPSARPAGRWRPRPRSARRTGRDLPSRADARCGLIAEEFGGAGFGAVESAVALEQSGYGMLPGAPLLPTSVRRRLIIGASASAELAKDLLPGIVEGGTVAAIAPESPAASPQYHKADGVRRSPRHCEARARCEDRRPAGAGGPAGGRRRRWFVLDAASAAVRELKERRPDAPQRRGCGVLDGVTVPLSRVLSGVDAVLVRDQAAVLMSAEGLRASPRGRSTARPRRPRSASSSSPPSASSRRVKHHVRRHGLVRVEQSRARLAWDAARARGGRHRRHPPTWSLAADRRDLRRSRSGLHHHQGLRADPRRHRLHLGARRAHLPAPRPTCASTRGRAPPTSCSSIELGAAGARRELVPRPAGRRDELRDRTRTSPAPALRQHVSTRARTRST